ncbi:MAG: hypothetical protein ACP5GU_04750 [Thermoprotei archaeon]
MSTSSISEKILSKINKIRVLDGILDFSKASTQLDILIALSDNREVTLDELASRVERGKRQVSDAIRKMLRKGFVRYEEKNGEILITIGENGIEYLKTLSDILSVDIKDIKTILVSSKTEITENLGVYFYIYETLIALGVSKRPLSLNKLASIIGISPNRLESYLDLFVSQDTPQKNLFEKVYKVSYRILRIRRLTKTITCYKLSETGMKIFYRLPFYSRYKNSITMRFLTKFMLTPHYETALRRFIKFYIIGTIIAFFILLVPYGWIAVAVWLYFSIIAFFIMLREM